MEDIEFSLEDSLGDFVNEEKEGSLTQLSKIVEDVLTKEEEVEKLEEELKEKTKILKYLKERTIPDILRNNGISEFTISGGKFDRFKLKIESSLQGSIPQDKDRNEIGMSYLSKIGGSNMISTELVVKFHMSEKDNIEKLYKQLNNEGFNVDKNNKVHHMSLKSFVNEVRNKGLEVELPKLGLFELVTVKIKKPK